MAALLADRALRVVSLEIDPHLVKFAKDNLARQGLSQVEVKEADASKGIDGEWDVIVASGGMEVIPDFLLDALKPGGRLVAIVGKAPVMTAQCITRLKQGGFHSVNLFETIAPMLSHFPKAHRFAF